MNLGGLIRWLLFTIADLALDGGVFEVASVKLDGCLLDFLLQEICLTNSALTVMHCPSNYKM